MKKLPIAILLILLVRAFFLINQSKEVMIEEPETITQEEVASDSAMIEPSDMVYSSEEIAKHTTPEDCWFSIDGTVYDVSNFAETHKGEEAVYEGCGLDATELFETRPMGSETPHSEDARGFLPNFEIGVLATE